MNALCGDCFANSAIRSCLVDTIVEFRCIRRVSQEGSMIRRLASLPWLRSGTVRQLRRYYQGAMTSCRPSRRTSLPSFGGTSAFTRSVRSPTDECAAEAWSLVTRYSGRDFAEETTASPKFLGDPHYPFAMFSRRRQDRGHQTGTVPQRGPWYGKSRGSHERSFDAQ